MSNHTPRKMSIRTICVIGMMGALSAVLIMLNFPTPFFPPFYKFDVGDLPALLSGFYMGPLAGFMTIVVKLLIKVMMQGSDSMMIGELSSMINSVALVLPASLVYRWKRSRKTAAIGLTVSTALCSVVSVLTNAFIVLPLYVNLYGMPLESIIGMGSAINPYINNLFTFLVFSVLPFNLIKSGITSVLTFLLYKRTSTALGRFLYIDDKRRGNLAHTPEGR